MTGWGIPYRGSKNQIAEWVVGSLPQADVLVDLFAGGCAVTRCALQSGRWGTVVANDWTDAPSVFVDAVNGAFADYCTVPTREEFEELKGEDRAIALLYSFGNCCDTYLWGRDIEDAKVHASRMLTAPTLGQRKSEYVLFLKSLPSVFESGRAGSMEKLEGLQRLQRLQRLQGLQGLERLQRLEGLDTERLVVSRRDYREVEVPEGAVVYCDPPYRGGADPADKRGYGEEAFDFGAFDEWLAAQDAVCVVSDYVRIEGCTVVAECQKRSLMSDKDNSTLKTELLMVPTKKEPEYRRMMAAFGQQALF